MYGGVPYAGGPYAGTLMVAADVPSQTQTTLAVEVAFTTDALTEPVWVDITSDVRSWDASRGRSRELERFQPGRATVVLGNLSRQYDSANAAGPWYGNVKPMRRIRVRETFNGVTYPVFDGFVDKWQLDYPDHGHDAIAVVTATDAFKILARTDLPRSVYTAEVERIPPVVWWRLDDIGHPAVVLSDVGLLKNGTVIGGPDFQAEPLIVNDLGKAMATPIDINKPSDKGADLDLSDAGLAVTGDTPLAIEFWLRRLPNNKASGLGGLESYALLFNPAGVVTKTRFGVTIANSTSSALLWHAVNDAETVEYGVKSNFNLALDVTYHVVCVHGSDRRLRIYIDGLDVTATDGAYGGTTAGTITADSLELLQQAGTASANTTPDAIVDEFAFYLGTLPALADFASHNAIGRAPWQGDLPGARTGRVLDLANWPVSLREVDTGITPLQSAELSTTVLEHLQKVTESELGLLFITRDGKVRFVGRTALFGRAVGPEVFGDVDGEVGYREFVPDDGDDVIRNRATVSRLNGVAKTVEDAASVSAYGRFDFVLDGLLHSSDSYSADYANLVVGEYKAPRRRITDLTVGPPIVGQEGAVYPAMLGPELGDVIKVRARPVGGGALFEQVCAVEGVRASGAPGGVRTTRFALSPEFAFRDWEDTVQIGYAQVVANQNAVAGDLTGLSVLVTVGAGRRIRITGFIGEAQNTAANAGGFVRIMEGVAQLAQADWMISAASTASHVNVQSISTPVAGVHTYKLSGGVQGGGVFNLLSSATTPAFILVEDIGPA